MRRAGTNALLSRSHGEGRSTEGACVGKVRELARGILAESDPRDVNQLARSTVPHPELREVDVDVRGGAHSRPSRPAGGVLVRCGAESNRGGVGDHDSVRDQDSESERNQGRPGPITRVGPDRCRTRRPDLVVSGKIRLVVGWGPAGTVLPSRPKPIAAMRGSPTVTTTMKIANSRVFPSGLRVRSRLDENFSPTQTGTVDLRMPVDARLRAGARCACQVGRSSFSPGAGSAGPVAATEGGGDGPETCRPSNRPPWRPGRSADACRGKAGLGDLERRPTRGGRRQTATRRGRSARIAETVVRGVMMKR